MEASNLEDLISYRFKDRNLLLEALTHRSYLNERSDWKVPNNERLEFLGDAVLELAVTEELFHRFPDQEEGDLTSYRSALVNYQMLAHVGRGIKLDDFILLSRGEAKDTNRAREVIVANAVESVIGAIYLDGGYEAASAFVRSFVLTNLDEVLRQGLYKDAKSLLQERVQNERKVTPTYRVIREFGPDHQKVFEIGVYFDETKIAEGSGPSKQDAEIAAAKRALEILYE